MPRIQKTVGRADVWEDANVARRNRQRLTLLDALDLRDRNAYCRLDELTNEAAVEMFFVNRLLTDLGYNDPQIKPKTAISEVMVGTGARKVRYKPDYILSYRNTPRWVLDAKAPTEALEDWEEQAAGYCLYLNQRSERGNPVQYYVLTNGIKTRVYQWDQLPYILELDFEDFQAANPKFEALRSLLSATAISRQKVTSPDLFELRIPTSEEARRVFVQAHKIIWESEVINPTAAFEEFAKLMFVKLWADKMLRTDEAVARELERVGRVSLPKDRVAFSNHWI